MVFRVVITDIEALRMSKRKCGYCGERKEKSTMFISPLMAFCNSEHAAKYAFDNKAKGDQKVHRQKKKEFNENDIKLRKSSAVSACHAYIRARDVNKGCVTCGRSLIGVKFDAGHFFKSTHSYTKFMEKNIHGQCVNCNQYNGGRELEYSARIVDMYGMITLKALEKCKDKKVKRTAQDYKKIELYYKDKLKQLEGK